ncbi:MAG: SH3 domain-containing protein [Candidatus Dormibacteraeota bacterium]|nr:SH3 domain-containing protein [Candidatus Dormibacteraeota bacterium]
MGSRRVLGLGAAIALIGSGTLGACSVLPSGSAPHSNAVPASSARVTEPSAAPSPTLPAAVSVISNVGLNLRSAPSRTAPLLKVVGWGEQLTVSGTEVVGADTWYHVTTQGGTVGWVVTAVDGQPTVNARRMTAFDEANGLYRNLYPSDWTVQKGNPAVFTAPSSDPEQGSLLIQTAPDLAHLPTIPVTAGRTLGQAGPVLVYGVTKYYTVYQRAAGGFEFDLQLQQGPTAYLFEYVQLGRTEADHSFYETLLATVILPSPQPSPS